MQVQLFTTCLINALYPETGEATIRLLKHFGVDLVVPKGQTCCGKPPDSGGYVAESRKAARHTINVLEGPDPVVVPSGSCASMIRNHYPHLFEDDPEMHARAVNLASRTYELSQFLVHELSAHRAGLKGNGRITYHASCQLTRELGVVEEPLLLLQSLEGARFVHLPHADRCCGFGGVFMARQPEISMAMADEKAESVLKTDADTLTGCDHGCLMNIADALSRRGSNVQVKHLAVVLAEAL